MLNRIGIILLVAGLGFLVPGCVTHKKYIPPVLLKTVEPPSIKPAPVRAVEEEAGPVPLISMDQSTFQQALAGHELRRYIFLRTGFWLKFTDHADEDSALFVLARKDSPALPPALRKKASLLKPQEYWLKSVDARHKRTLFIVGGDDLGVLYGAYRFAEKLGVRFYLAGDVIPDEKITLSLPEMDVQESPLFALRGILPFHDFPEGPDWWNTDDYLAYIGQLPKLRMNFFGLHTYPENGPHAEPTVWIGPPGEADDEGNVKNSYPAFYANTADNGNWGYARVNTGDFAAGAASLFATNQQGAEVQNGCLPMGTNAVQQNLVFNRTADMLRTAFTQAHALGVKTVVGTEMPLTIPQAVKERLWKAGRKPDDPAVVRELYRGLFRRIARSYPIDYYWLWTPEDWTWHNAWPDAVAATKTNLQAAISALKEIGSPFQLATCGWEIGPPGDPLAFDRLLPPGAPVSSLNRQTGHDGIDAAFAQLSGRPKWMIPWIENDPDLTMPQLWVGRLRQDAVDSRRLGGEGLIGLLWRTKVTGMNVAALADAAWNQSWASATNLPPIPTNGPVSPDTRKAACVDFYVDWATANFGKPAGRPVGELFARLDGKDFPNPANWVGGPGGILTDQPAWSQEQQRYAFVDELANLRGNVTGPGNQARFDYWLHTFKYMRLAAQTGCTAGELQLKADEMNQENDSIKKSRLAQDAVAIRVKLSRLWEAMLTEQLAAAETPGELGTIANLEQHNRVFLHLLDKQDAAITNVLGRPLPTEAALSHKYTSKPRLFVPTIRTQVASDETLRIQAIVLSDNPVSDVTVFFHQLGANQYFTEKPMQHLGHGVYETTLPPANDDFEYRIEARTGGKILTWPATAPGMNQTVVVVSPRS